MDVRADLRRALEDRYRLERELGSGASAVVYLARDLRHARDVAIKVLRPDLISGFSADRFLREIRISASLQHPHILALYDSGEAAGQIYCVMPYVKGETLRAMLRREKALPIDEALRLTRQIADALSHAHKHGIVHRDIKPENILLAGGEAFVADFGIAHSIGAEIGDRLTQTGTSIGTPHYMSPEQATGERELDGRSDIYSLGCVTYEMLAGEPPFDGPSMQAVISRHLQQPAPSVRVIRKSVPGHIDDAIQVALSKAPVDRFRDASAFASALEDPDYRPTLTTLSGRATRSSRHALVAPRGGPQALEARAAPGRGARAGRRRCAGGVEPALHAGPRPRPPRDRALRCRGRAAHCVARGAARPPRAEPERGGAIEGGAAVARRGRLGRAGRRVLGRRPRAPDRRTRGDRRLDLRARC